MIALLEGSNPGKSMPAVLADQASSSVAADEVVRPERRVVGNVDVDTGLVLGEAHDLAAAQDRNPELADPVRQDGLEAALPQGEDVVVAGGEVAEVQGDSGEPVRRGGVPRFEEPFRDASLIEHLDRAGEQPTGPPSFD